MIIIGEKLNSSIPSALEIMNAKNEGALLELVAKQVANGADYIDINTALCGASELCENAGEKSAEKTAMEWLLNLIFSNGDVLVRSSDDDDDDSDSDGNSDSNLGCGIMLDSPDPEAILHCLPMVGGRKVIINSVTLDSKYDALIFAARDKNAKLIGLPIVKTQSCAQDCAQNSSAASNASASAFAGGFPDTAEKRVANACALADKLVKNGIPAKNIYIDALVEAVATNGDAGKITLDTIKMLKKELPEVNTVVGLSNVSFGLPGRARLNTAFLAMAIASGLDAAILDPTSPRVIETLASVNALLGSDEYCMKYISYHRSTQGR